MTQETDGNGAGGTVRNSAGKYLTFGLGAEEYGIPVLRVREILKMLDIVTVPQLPAHVRGVVNLRGKVIPVVDLRVKFARPAVADTDETCIIVVEVSTDAARATMGLVVDRVCEVLNIVADEIDDTPGFGAGVQVSYVSGVAKVKGTVKLLLDLDSVLGADAATTFDAAA